MYLIEKIVLVLKLSLFLYLLRDDGDNPETEEDAGPADESEIPEPEEYVDLLVDDVQGENAQPVVVNDRS